MTEKKSPAKPRARNPKLGVLTPEQKLKQKEATIAHNKSTTGTIKTPQALNTMARKLEALLDPALENIKRVIDGDESVSNKQADLSKWVVQQVVSIKNAAQQARLKKIEIASKEKEAKDNGLLIEEDKTPKEKAEEFGSPRLVLDYDPEWDTESEDD